MTPARTRPGAGWTIAWILGSVVVAAIVFAPLMTAGFCADSSIPGRSYCASSQHSLIGVPTSFWIWLGATAAFGIIAWIASHAFWRPRRASAEE
ncbi:hypothetical protein GCM10009775_14980 [Microbacterium aoyamense]|uniref:Vitamin K epoxide reductase family protein n=1 Tax=Microbacterium aoyamense TaxID=344166 RepID=A0ABN2PJN0_9MICO|nr:hypothetical protein [Microbacterium aoyamense]